MHTILLGVMRPAIVALALMAAASAAQSPDSNKEDARAVGVVGGAMTPSDLLALGIRSETVRSARSLQLDLTSFTTQEDGYTREGRLRARAGGSVTLTFTGSGDAVRFDGMKVEESFDGYQTWSGLLHDESSDESAGHVELTFGPTGTAFGTAHFGGLYYEIRPSSSRPNTYALVELDLDSFPEHECHTELPPGSKSLGISKSSYQKLGGGSSTVDIMVLYTGAVSSSQDPILLINNAVANANSSFADSGISAYARVVYYGLVSYNETGKAMRTTRDELTYYSPGHPPPGGVPSTYQLLDGIHALRDQQGADVVLMIVDRSITSADPQELACGIAWGVPNLQSDNDTFAFGVVGDDCVNAPTYSFTHELGHLLSGYHDWGQFGGNHPDPYYVNHGYWRAAGSLRSIMALGTGCTVASCPRLRRWSDPSATVSGGPFGIADNRPLVECGPDPGDTQDPTLCPSDMEYAINQFASVAASHRTNGNAAPGAPASVTVTREYCYGSNLVDWTAGSGVTGWYEVEKRPSSSYAWSQIYRGPSGSIPIVVSETTYIRARACNSQGCSGYRNANTTAIYYSGCM